MQAPADLADRTFDLLVVGGGINGAAIARDAALRGLSVCLVEKHDWAWGTSAKSSKLAHGGLRYLEQMEFGLVHEALQDRERFLAHAPHLVRPLRFLYPIYPHVAARRAVRAGLLLYDMLSHGKSLPKRKYLRLDKVLELAPGLATEGLAGGATYYDAQIQSVERLVVEMVADARSNGAVCLNHAPMAALRIEPDGPGRRCTGATVTVDGRSVEVRARAVVNATGCWVDETLGRLSQGKPAKVRKTKGIHVVVPKFTEVALIVKAAIDGRTFFILPWRDACVIGTTDTDYHGDAGDAVAEADDVAYLLDSAARYFPEAPLDQILYTYAGVRALVNEEGVTESNVTRRHILFEHGQNDLVAGLWSLQGGKITTARTLAEECVHRVATFLGRPELVKVRPTRTMLYPGGPAHPWSQYRPSAIQDARALGFEEAIAAHLVDTYGARWRQVVECDERPEARERLVAAHPHIGCEVTWAVRMEDARDLADVTLRRTTLGLAADGNPAAARAVAAWMGPLRGWDEAATEAQLRAHFAEASHLAIPNVPVPMVRTGAGPSRRPAPRAAPVRSEAEPSKAPP
ncbi:MAG: glycerol-3-phosphate dehydrogenase [Thermoplasmata archaeon]|nr:glycerol-3-phosphate dehydrogenase [Thermoplasmata archaeon]